jgi:hypothetical protein
MKLNKETKSQIKLVATGFAVMLLVYLLFIQLWDLTSLNYKPANFLDLEVKTPADSSTWLNRREHGI